LDGRGDDEHAVRQCKASALQIQLAWRVRNHFLPRFRDEIWEMCSISAIYLLLRVQMEQRCKVLVCIELDGGPKISLKYEESITKNDRRLSKDTQ
jgi:hypothetical protein